MNLVRDVQVQFTIEVLRRVGVSPRGTLVSGCRILAEALELSEDTVMLIWKERGSAKPFDLVLRRHLDAISRRTGLVYTNED